MGRRGVLWLIGVVVVAGGAFVLFWFQPQKLWIDDRVEEPIPVVAVDDRRASTSAAQLTKRQARRRPARRPPPFLRAAEPVEVARGEFVSLDHGTAASPGCSSSPTEAESSPRGTRHVERARPLLYLTSTPAAGEKATFDDEFVNLGRLKGNQGDQNYELPPDTDLTRFATVVIWCDRFDSAFGAADLATT